MNIEHRLAIEMTKLGKEELKSKKEYPISTKECRIKKLKENEYRTPLELTVVLDNLLLTGQARINDF